MPVVANISIMLSLQSGQYRSGMTDAQKMNKQFAKSAAEAGYSLREIANGVKLVRPALETQQKAMESYKRTVRSLDGLQRSGLAKQLGIDPEEIAKLKRVAFEEQQAAFQGKESPAAIAARDEEKRNKSITRGLSLLQKEDVALKKLRQDLIDIKVAADANKDLYRSGQYTKTRDQLLANFHGEKIGNQIPAAQQIANEQAAARKRQQIEAENVEAIRATQTAQQQRYAELSQLRSDELGGLSKEAAARRRAAIEARFQENSGGSDLLKLRKNIQDNYNAAVQRGVEIANAARTAQQQYRQTVKDVSKALRESKISQDQFNRAKLQAKRNREDSQLDPILRAGVQSVAPYKQVVRDVTRNIENMRAALKSGLVTKQEFDNSFSGGLGKLRQYSLALGRLRNRLKQGELSQREFTLAAKQARAAIFGQTSAIQRLMSTVGVFRTVLIGMASAQLYGAVFEGTQDGFTFEKDIRSAIALFGELGDAQKRQLRETVLSSTNNDVSLLERTQVLKELARDGIDAATAIANFDLTLKFAATSGLDAGDSVSKVSEVMKAYRLETKNAAEDSEILRQVMDLLVTSANQTASDVREMAEALIRAAPQANQLGISLRDVAAGAIALSEIGRKGEVGGNELAIALRDITNKAIENREAFEALGVQVFDNQGSFTSMALTIRSLQDALGGLSAEERVAALAQLGVTQKASQFQQQLVLLLDVIENARTSFEDTDGAVERLHRESIPQLNIATNKLKTAFANLVNNTAVSWLESLATETNKLSDSSVRSAIETAAFVGSLTLMVATGPQVIATFRAITAATIAYSRAAAVAQALSGPKGWLTLAASVGVAYVASKQFAGLFEDDDFIGAAGLQKGVESLGQLTDAIDVGRRDMEYLKSLADDTFHQLRVFLQDQFNEEFELNDDGTVKSEAINNIAKQLGDLRRLVSDSDYETLKRTRGELQNLLQQFRNFGYIPSSDVEGIEQAYDRLVTQINTLKDAYSGLDEERKKADKLKTDREAQSNLEKLREDVRESFRQINQAVEDLGGLEGRVISRNLNEILGGVDVSSNESLTKSTAEIRALSAQVNAFLNQSATEQRLTNSFDEILTSVLELKKNLEIIPTDLFGDELDRQAISLKRQIEEELKSPVQRAIDELNQVIALDIQLRPDIEQKYFEKVAEDLGQLQNEVTERTRFNVAAAARGSVEEFSFRVSAFNDPQKDERRKQHAELIRNIKTGNLTLQSMLERLQAIQRQESAIDGPTPEDLFDF